MSYNERRTDDVAVLDASAASWRGFCTFLRKRRDNRQWRKFGVIRSNSYTRNAYAISISNRFLKPAFYTFHFLHGINFESLNKIFIIPYYVGYIKTLTFYHG